MPSQADAIKVQSCVIDPMKRHWAAEFDSDTIADFVDDLARFPEKVLRDAMQAVRNECKRKPSLAHITEACKGAREHSGMDTSSAEAFFAALTKRDFEADRMTNDFLRCFESSPLATKAKSENWFAHLMRYAYEMARLQAQHMCKVSNPGYNQSVITNNKTLQLEEIEARIKTFTQFCKEQSATGTILISVPNYLIDEWKADYEASKRVKQVVEEKEKRPELPMTEFQKSAIELEIERQLGEKAA